VSRVALVFKKNTTGEQFGPPSGWRVRYCVYDGSQATDDEIDLIYGLYTDEHIVKNKNRRTMVDASESQSVHGQYRIEIERDDGFPLTNDEANMIVLMDYMRLREFAAAASDINDIEIICTTKNAQRAIATLPQAAARTWAVALQQLTPNNDDCQTVHLLDAKGAMHLLKADLIEHVTGLPENTYLLRRDVAYCFIENRQ